QLRPAPPARSDATGRLRAQKIPAGLSGRHLDPVVCHGRDTPLPCRQRLMETGFRKGQAWFRKLVAWVLWIISRAVMLAVWKNMPFAIGPRPLAGVAGLSI